MTDKEKNKIVDILFDFYDEYQSNEINRPMIPSIYADKILDSLKVKEVDLEKEIDNYIYSHLGRPRMALELDWKYCDIKIKPEELINFARHFYELGLSVSNKAQKGE